MLKNNATKYGIRDRLPVPRFRKWYMNQFYNQKFPQFLYNMYFFNINLCIDTRNLSSLLKKILVPIPVVSLSSLRLAILFQLYLQKLNEIIRVSTNNFIHLTNKRRWELTSINRIFPLFWTAAFFQIQSNILNCT